MRHAHYTLHVTRYTSRITHYTYHIPHTASPSKYTCTDKYTYTALYIMYINARATYNMLFHVLVRIKHHT